MINSNMQQETRNMCSPNDTKTHQTARFPGQTASEPIGMNQTDIFKAKTQLDRGALQTSEQKIDFYPTA
jgi:hypothetical protein